MRNPEEPYVKSYIEGGKLIIRFSYPNTELEPGMIKEATLTDHELLALFHNACEVIAGKKR